MTAMRDEMRLVAFLRSPFGFFMHMVGVLGLNLDDDRKPRLSIDQRRQVSRGSNSIASK